MLQLIRNWVQGWLAVAVVGILIVPFAFWGINYYFDGGAEAVAATVNDSKISLREYQRSLQNLRQRLNSLDDAPAIDDARLKSETLDILVDRTLLVQAAADLGVRVSNRQVREVIESVSAFQGMNGFDEALYETNVSVMGLTPTAFENQVREDMSSQQLRTALTDSQFVTDQEVERTARIRDQRRSFHYAVLSSDDAKESVEVTDADIETYYDGHPELYVNPARVRIAYLDLSLDRIALDIPYTGEALQRHYEEHRANYGTEEQRKVRQLLVATPDDASGEQMAAAEQRATALYQEVAAGASMEEIVEQQGDSPEVAVEFSEFGYLSRGVLEGEVDDVAFSLEEGAVSQPVQSSYGYHILEVEKIRGGDIPPFEEIRDQVAQDYQHAEAGKVFYEMADQLATLAFEHPDSLEAASEAVDLPIRTSDLFSREDPGSEFLAHPQILGAAFSEEVLRNGNNSELLELDTNHVVVLRVTEHIPEQRRPLHEVRDRIATRIRYERARDRTRALGEEIIERLRGGQPREALAAEYGLEWSAADGVTRDDPDVNRAVLRTAFSTGAAGSGTAVDGVSLGTGDYAIVAVTAVSDPDLDALGDSRLNSIQRELQRDAAADAWEQYVTERRRTAEIRIFQERL